MYADNENIGPNHETFNLELSLYSHPNFLHMML